ncbi:hypothetical protein CYLTODRAFT_416964 [Cylindrobasidium torrendii FP15055 ss-10]|uniref:Mid2 domain-containing protein n=1 Tax=Cylindrobasidium torrendii FP15055 ss-10 TaxID=1314674 RepID=A0A0D7BVD8_9AGAR|nr:hypothetical protein CYLTODRAFT_416964 [Cylindrobasidium torrendii FP15055 ss-10]
MLARLSLPIFLLLMHAAGLVSASAIPRRAFFPGLFGEDNDANTDTATPTDQNPLHNSHTALSQQTGTALSSLVPHSTKGLLPDSPLDSLLGLGHSLPTSTSKTTAGASSSPPTATQGETTELLTSTHPALPPTHIGVPSTRLPTATAEASDSSHTVNKGKVVGITAACIAGAVILTIAVALFDTWWGWLKGKVTGKKKGDDSDVRSLRSSWEKPRAFDWPDHPGRYSGAHGSPMVDKMEGVGAHGNHRLDPYMHLQNSVSPHHPTPTYAPWHDTLLSSDPYTPDPLYRKPSSRSIPR